MLRIFVWHFLEYCSAVHSINAKLNCLGAGTLSTRLSKAIDTSIANYLKGSYEDVEIRDSK